MKSLILTLLIGTLLFVGKAIQGNDSLKLYLPFEEGKGAKDKSGNGNDGTLEGETNG